MELLVMMLASLIVFGLFTLIFAILYMRASFRLRQLVKAQGDERLKLQAEMNALQKKISANSVDPVTHLLGWQVFEDRISQSIKECARYKFIMGVMYIDIDGFKLINEAMGEDVGNALLFQVGERLQSCIRQVDSISRKSKDTFVVLLAQLAKQETAAIIIQRMLQMMAHSFEVKGHKLTITACIGVAFYPGDGLTANALTNHAESAMRQAKLRGKNTYQFYQEQLQADSQRELSIYNSLSSDMFLDELKLFYQPIMDIETQQMVCAETQIVWQHTTLGEISGEELFAYADKHRKLNKITERALEQACKQFLEWRTLGLKPQMLGVPVLLQQLEHPQLVYRLSQIMQEMKMDPTWLMLEIRESAVPVSLDILEKSFNMLHYMKVKIAVDRFGSGSFSLRYLKMFAVDYLKLDRALFIDIVENEQSRAMVKSLVAFANMLSISVIATGVDTEAQVAVLKEIGIALMQGQLLSAPLSESEMADKMTTV
jgi:diguanylate cyclase (GGDEF)-like protein